MYQIIPMSSKVNQKLHGVTVLGIELELNPIETEPKQLIFMDDWKKLHEKWRGKSKSDVSQTERIVSYQNFYKLMGLNPKKVPPSAQNIIQRFLIKEKLDRVPIIHPVVDAVNVAAVESLIPLGVFDVDAVEGEIRLMLSRGSELFQPLGSQEPEVLGPDVLVLCDDKKVLSQFCYRDGEAQKITENTRRIQLLGCQVPGVEIEAVQLALDNAQKQLRRIYQLSIR